jgi:hypothetical protein
MFETLGNIGDFIGGVAIIITLIYLAAQIRQNTRALKTASRQEIVAGFREFNRLYLQPGGDDAMTQGVRHYPNIAPELKHLFETMMNDLALFFQGVFALYEAGTLEEETYQTYLTLFAAWVNTPGGAAWWTDINPLYTPRMVEAMRVRVEAGDLPDLLTREVFADSPAV